DENRGVRMMCARALGTLGYRARSAIPNLIQSLTKYSDSAGVVAEAICWIGATGDDAKKLIALAKEPTAPPARVARVIALGGAGKEALPVLEEIKKGLAPTDRLRGNIQDAEQWADRDNNLIVQLALLRTKGKTAHEAARNALRYEMKPEQLKQYVDG